MITSGRPKSHETLPDMTANDSHEQERTAKVQSDEQSPTENAVEIWEATEPQWEGDRPEIIAAKPSLFQRLRRNRSDDVIVPKGMLSPFLLYVTLSLTTNQLTIFLADILGKRPTLRVTQTTLNTACTNTSDIVVCCMCRTNLRYSRGASRDLIKKTPWKTLYY